MSRRRLTLDSPTGAVTITEEDGAIVGVTWGGATVTSGGNEDGGLLQDAAQQLRDYFAGARHAFDLPLKPRGRESHRAVWREMLAIPSGHTKSYRDLSKTTRPTPRAAGTPSGAHPTPPTPPYHP